MMLLSALTSLTALVTRKCDVEADVLSALASKLPALHTLVAMHCIGRLKLGPVCSLRALDVRCSKVDLDALRSLPSLRHLSFTSMRGMHRRTDGPSLCALTQVRTSDLDLIISIFDDEI